jgi:hypothetical protein
LFLSISIEASIEFHFQSHTVLREIHVTWMGIPCKSIHIHPFESAARKTQASLQFHVRKNISSRFGMIWDDHCFFSFFFPLIFHGILQIPHRFKAAIAEAGAVPHLAALLKDPKAQVTAAGALRNLAAQNVANQEPFEETLPKGLKRRQLYDFVCYIDDNLIYIIFVLFTSVVLFFM